MAYGVTWARGGLTPVELEHWEGAGQEGRGCNWRGGWEAGYSSWILDGPVHLLKFFAAAPPHPAPQRGRFTGPRSHSKAPTRAQWSCSLPTWHLAHSQALCTASGRTPSPRLKCRSAQPPTVFLPPPPHLSSEQTFALQRRVKGPGWAAGTEVQDRGANRVPPPLDSWSSRLLGVPILYSFA